MGSVYGERRVYGPCGFLSERPFGRNGAWRKALESLQSPLWGAPQAAAAAREYIILGLFQEDRISGGKALNF